MDLAEHTTGLIFTVILVILMGIVGELEYNDLQHVQQNHRGEETHG